MYKKVTLTHYIALDCDDDEIQSAYTSNDVNMIITDDGYMAIMLENIGTNNDMCILAEAFNLIKQKEITKFRKLITKNKNIIDKKYNGTFLIHESCIKAVPECTALLLFLGAKCSVLNCNGMTAQHCAVLSGSTIMIDILSLFGHSMNILDANKKTPFEYAINSSDNEMIRALMVYKECPFIAPFKEEDTNNQLDEYIKEHK